MAELALIQQNITLPYFLTAPIALPKNISGYANSPIIIPVFLFIPTNNGNGLSVSVNIVNSSTVTILVKYSSMPIVTGNDYNLYEYTFSYTFPTGNYKITVEYDSATVPLPNGASSANGRGTVVNVSINSFPE